MSDLSGPVSFQSISFRSVSFLLDAPASASRVLLSANQLTRVAPFCAVQLIQFAQLIRVSEGRRLAYPDSSRAEWRRVEMSRDNDNNDGLATSRAQLRGRAYLEKEASLVANRTHDSDSGARISAPLLHFI